VQQQQRRISAAEDAIQYKRKCIKQQNKTKKKNKNTFCENPE